MLLGDGLGGIDYGIIVTTLTVGGTALWSLLRYAVVSAFDKKEGILPKYYEEYKRKNTAEAKKHEWQLRMCEEHGIGIAKIHNEFPCGKQFQTVGTNKILANLAQVELLKIKSVTDMVQEDRDAIIALLSSSIEIAARSVTCDGPKVQIKEDKK